MCGQMGCAENSIRLECLNQDDARKLFEDKVGKEIIKELGMLAREVQSIYLRSNRSNPVVPLQYARTVINSTSPSTHEGVLRGTAIKNSEKNRTHS